MKENINNIMFGLFFVGMLLLWALVNPLIQEYLLSCIIISFFIGFIIGKQYYTEK